MVSDGGSALARAGGVLALDLDGVLFLSPEPAGVAGEYADRRRVRGRVTVPPAPCCCFCMASVL